MSQSERARLVTGFTRGRLVDAQYGTLRCHSEGYDIVTSIYVNIQILTTVGYGALHQTGLHS